jgi:hypothetical protein
MSFFDSEVVRAEMAEISELQEAIYSNIFEFPKMDVQKKLEHVDMLERLLNRQRVLYTRLSLSEDPKAREMKKRIVESASLMGLPLDVDLNIIFNNMSSLIRAMREQIDKAGSDL